MPINQPPTNQPPTNPQKPQPPIPAPTDNKTPGDPNPKETPSNPHADPRVVKEEEQKRSEEKRREEARVDVEKVRDDIKNASSERDKKRTDLLRKIGEKLKQYGQESDIPLTDDYWSLTGQYRAT